MGKVISFVCTVFLLLHVGYLVGCGSESDSSVAAASGGGGGTTTALCTGLCTYDTFGRADSNLTLGSTEGGTVKTWSYPGASIFGILSSGAYKVAGGTQTIG